MHAYNASLWDAKNAIHIVHTKYILFVCVLANMRSFRFLNTLVLANALFPYMLDEILILNKVTYQM